MSSLNSTPASEQSEGKAAWRVIKRAAPFIWPSDNFDLRARVVLALLALVAAKAIAILGPILQASAVDELAGGGAPEFALGAIGLTVACLLYTSPSPRDRQKSRMPSSA